MRTKIAFWPSVLAAALLAACGGGGSFEIDILSDETGCNGLTGIIRPGSQVELTVRGPGMSPIKARASGSDRRLELTEIPEGPDRVVTVEVREGGGSGGGDLLAWGESEPFEVTSDGAPRVRVVLYRTNYFMEVVGPSGTCAEMLEPRAGHVAIALSENEVLLAGGYTGQRDGQPDGILDSVELFNLRSGTFRPGPAMPSPRAYARAVTLHDGRVLVVGGVMESGGELVPVADAMIFDGKSWKTVEMAHARRGHTVSLIDRTGEVLVVGGIDAENQIVGAVELFDPQTDTFRELELPGGAGSFARAHHVAVAHEDNVVIAGGIDTDGRVLADVSILTWNNAQRIYLGQSNHYSLDTPVMMPVAMVLGSAADPKLVVAGGYTVYSADPNAPGAGTPSSQTNALQLHGLLSRGGQTSRTNLTTSVAGSCGLPLHSNRGIVVGGVRGSVVASGYGDLVVYSRNNNSLQASQAGETRDRRPKAAKDLACTPIGKNGVLITGGGDTDGTVKGQAIVYFGKSDRSDA